MEGRQVHAKIMMAIYNLNGTIHEIYLYLYTVYIYIYFFVFFLVTVLKYRMQNDLFFQRIHPSDSKALSLLITKFQNL